LFERWGNINQNYQDKTFIGQQLLFNIGLLVDESITPEEAQQNIEILLSMQEQESFHNSPSTQPAPIATARASINELITKYRGYILCRDGRGRECLVPGASVIFRHKQLPDLEAVISNRGHTVPGSFSTVDARSQGTSPTPVHHTRHSFMGMRWSRYKNNWVQVYFDPDEWERLR